MFTVKVTGTQRTNARLQQFSKDVPEASAMALYRTGERIITRAKKVYCPVDTGYLRSTGYVKTPEWNGRGYVVELGFNAEYALYVHENIGAKFRVGTYKFLERAVGDAQQQRWLDREVSRVMKVFA